MKAPHFQVSPSAECRLLARGFSIRGVAHGESAVIRGSMMDSVVRSGEVSWWTDRFEQAMEGCLRRLRESAMKLKGNAVIQATLRIEHGGEETKIQAMGLTILDPRRPNDSYLSCTLELSDYLTLDTSGYQVLGSVYGCCGYHQVAWKIPPKIKGMRWQNQEMSELTEGLYAARSITMSRLHAAANRLGPTGVIDIDFDLHITSAGVNGQSSAMNLFSLAQGTAVSRYWPNKVAVDLVMPL